MLLSVAKKLAVRWDEAEAAAAEAETLGWPTMEGRHSVCLTYSGNRLAPTPSPEAQSAQRPPAGGQGARQLPGAPVPLPADCTGLKTTW